MAVSDTDSIPTRAEVEDIRTFVTRYDVESVRVDVLRLLTRLDEAERLLREIVGPPSKGRNTAILKRIRNFLGLPLPYGHGAEPWYERRR